jgi:anti-sigma regulatory factor (Ser/Thr protein kinase)
MQARAEQFSIWLGPYWEQLRTMTSSPGSAKTGPRRNPMNAMAPTRPPERQEYRVRLATGPAAPAKARREVRAAIRAWDVPVDDSAAALLTSELVTNAVRQEPGATVTLTVARASDHVRVDVHDTSRRLPVLVDAPVDAESGRGLMLVATLSDDWGVYRTAAGKALYFTLAFQPALAG